MSVYCRIGISVSKLGNSVSNLCIEFDGYNRHRNRLEKLAYDVRNYLSFTKRNYFTHNTETIFIDIFLPNTKPMTVDIIHRPPSQTNFLEIVNEHFQKLDIDDKDS